MAECIVGGVAPKNVYTIDGTSYSRILKVDVNRNRSLDSQSVYWSSYTLGSGRIVRMEIPAATIITSDAYGNHSTASISYQLFTDSGSVTYLNAFTFTVDFQAGTITLRAGTSQDYIYSPVYANIFVLDI